MFQNRFHVKSDSQKNTRISTLWFEENLFFYFSGKAPSDDQSLTSLNLKNGFKIMMMGSVEQAIQDVNEVPTDLPTG